VKPTTADYDLGGSDSDTERDSGDDDADDADVSASDGGGSGGQSKAKRTRPKLVPCAEEDEGARRRFKSTAKNKWRPFTAGYLLAFFAILIATSAMHTRDAKTIWSTEYGVGVSWIQNTMSRDAFNQARQYFHIVDSSKLPKEPVTAKQKEWWL
jgi:hypothetical protein